jgi:hypothetical protein
MAENPKNLFKPWYKLLLWPLLRGGIRGILSPGYLCFIPGDNDERH